jgi:hypothetical protein
LVKKTKKEEIWECELVPKQLVIKRFFETEKNLIQELEANIESIKAADFGNGRRTWSGRWFDGRSQKR